MTTGNNQTVYGQEDSGKRIESIEATLAEKIASLLEGEVRSKEDMAHKTMQIISQKDLELAGLNEKIRLLESFNRKKEESEPLDGAIGGLMPPFIFSNKPEFHLRIEDDEESKSGRVTPTHSASSNSDTTEEKDGTKRKLIKEDVRVLDNFAKNDVQHLHVLNTKLLSAIYNESQLRKDEQNNFMKIISQLSDVVKELKDQNNINNMIKKTNDLVLEPQALTIECQYGTTISPRSSPHRTNAERDCDVIPKPLDLKDVQNLMSAWDQMSNVSKVVDSNETSAPDSVHSMISLYSEKSEQNLKFRREKSRTIKKKIQNKIFQDKLKNLSFKLRNQGKYLAKTKGVLKQFQEQGKTITSVVEDIKNDQEKEKFVLESLITRIEKLAKNDDLVYEQSGEIKDLEERICRIESRLIENNGRMVYKDKEIFKLMEELKKASLMKDEYQTKNAQLNKEISDCFIRLASNKKQIEELKETIRKEKALNDSIKQNYEVNLRNVVGNAVQEQRQIIQEIKMSFDNNIAALQTENSELKTRIYQLEEDGKKICNDSKIRVVKAKKQLYSQASIASQKLLKADGKIKEFYYTIELN
ncbi:uncharacterized protein [Halyomorpha halys]|uniref:uncharacterized protein isoform X2 n=1 Tax=Halyomorpha halys TaxID=286706 RepID=UPI0034D1E8C9